MERRRWELNPQNPVTSLADFKSAEPSGLLIASVIENSWRIVTRNVFKS